MPASRVATRDYGVLEQDVLIEPFLDMCRAAGFQDVRLCPISYIIPEFELTPDDWRAWKQLPRTKRPIRAMGKMWRAVLEFFGIGKGSVLFEEAFAMRLVRLLQVPVEEHPFIVASKTGVRQDRRPAYRARIEVRSLPSRSAPGEPLQAELTVTNAGSVTWPSKADQSQEMGQVRVGIQLLDGSSRVISRDFARGQLDADVAPGESRTVRVGFRAPGSPGQYLLKIDLVAEGVTWFEPTGSNAEIRPIEVS
jgi:hypothetical protein